VKKFLFIFLFLGSVLFAGKGDNGQLLGYIKVDCLQDLEPGQKFDRFFRDVVPSRGAQMLPLMLFGPFGYPDFSGIDTTKNLTVYFFRDAKTQDIFFLAFTHMEALSPVRDSLKTLDLFTFEKRGYTLVSNASAVNIAEKDLQKLADFHLRRNKSDVRLKVYVPNVAADLRNFVETTDGTLAKVLDFLCSELKSIHTLTCACYLSNTEAVVGVNVESEPNKPFAKLLSAPLPTSVKANGFFPKDNAYACTLRINPLAVRQYLEYCLQHVADILQQKPQWQSLARGFMSLKDNLSGFLDMSDGTGAYTLNFGPQGMVGQGLYGLKKPILASDFEPKLKSYYERTMPALLTQYRYDCQRADVKEPIYAVEVANRGSDMPVVDKNYLTFTPDFVVMSNQIDTLRQMTAMKAPQKPSLADSLVLTDACAAMSSLNLSQWARQVRLNDIQKLFPEGNIKELTQLWERLQKTSLRPFEDKVFVEKGNLNYVATLPYETLKEMVALLDALLIHLHEMLPEAPQKVIEPNISANPPL